MAFKLQRESRETPQRLVYRFMKKMKESGILFEARKRQFKERTKSDTAQKKSALRREELKKEYEKLRKLGKI